jgi:hypothetical protein
LLYDEMKRRQGGRIRNPGTPIVGEARLIRERRIRNLHAWDLTDDDAVAFAAAIDRRGGRRIV